MAGADASRVWCDGFFLAVLDRLDVVITWLSGSPAPNGRVSEPRCETLLSFGAG